MACGKRREARPARPSGGGGLNGALSGSRYICLGTAHPAAQRQHGTHPRPGNHTTTMTHANRLILLGLALFLIGLVCGIFVPHLANPRMGLAAHLEGVMNGMFLVLLGLLWPHVDLPGTWAKATVWLAAYGTFGNVAAVLLAAATGAGKMMPLAGGKEGTPPVESVISFLLITLSLAMLAVCILVIAGFLRHIQQHRPLPSA